MRDRTSISVYDTLRDHSSTSAYYSNYSKPELNSILKTKFHQRSIFPPLNNTDTSKLEKKMSETKLVSLEEVAKHSSRTEAWFIIEGFVYDVSHFLDEVQVHVMLTT